MMHYDKKISCALGILLIGIVSALFFRHEKSEATEVPALSNAQSIDAKIARKTVRPYEAPSRLAGVIEEAPAENSTGSPKRPYEELPESDGDHLAAGTPPKPIAPGGNATSAIPGTGHNSEWTAIARNGVRPTSKRDEAQRTYKVRQGDTLSGISYRFLGSSARFNEIFEANRVLLRSPDDLRPGMTLRIPPRNRGTSAIVVKSTAQDAATEKSKTQNRKALTSTPPSTNQQPPSKSGNQPGKKNGANPSARRFIPIRRSPFRRKSFPLKSSENRSGGQQQEKHRRTLTQTPPPGVSASNKSAGDKTAATAKKSKTAAKPVSTSERPGTRPIVYVVQPGDSLERIAVKFYGRRRATARILNANRQRLKNPNLLRPGTRLLLPQP